VSLSGEGAAPLLSRATNLGAYLLDLNRLSARDDVGISDRSCPARRAILIENPSSSTAILNPDGEPW
jgi:hypothetical protein